MTSARPATRRPATTVRRRSAAAVRRRVTPRPSCGRPEVRRRATVIRRPRRGWRARAAAWWPALLVIVIGVVGMAWDAGARPEPVPGARCTLPVSGYLLTGEQLANAKTIAQVAHERGLPDRAVVIALATALQESHLRNLPYGDRDSLGLFQQRPSQGWGTPQQVQDPAYAAGKFFDHLVQVPNWQTGPLTVVAQTVQRSGAPGAYAKWEGIAQEITTQMDAGKLDANGC